MHSLPAYIKKLSACLLLGLFLFIQAEKSLHEHNGTTHHISGKANISGIKASCLLCEFQLAADADIPCNNFTLTAVHPAAEHTVYYNPVYFTSVITAFAQRGPPSYC